MSGSGPGLGSGPGETRQGVRHIIAARDEVRSLAADQQGRWSLPGANGIRGRLGVSGWRIDDAAPGTLDSALDPALCLSQAGLTVLGRPGDGRRAMKGQG